MQTVAEESNIWCSIRNYIETTEAILTIYSKILCLRPWVAKKASILQKFPSHFFPLPVFILEPSHVCLWDILLSPLPAYMLEISSTIIGWIHCDCAIRNRIQAWSDSRCRYGLLLVPLQFRRHFPYRALLDGSDGADDTELALIKTLLVPIQALVYFYLHGQPIVHAMEPTR